MSWFLLALGAVFTLAIAELTQQKLLTKADAAYSPRTSSVLTFLVQWILAIPVVLLCFTQEQVFGWINSTLSLQVLCVTALASIAMVFYLKSFVVKSISFSQIFGTTSVIVSTALGIALFSESTSLVKFAGIALVLLAIVILAYKNTHVEKNNYYALLSGLIFGICFTLDKSITMHVEPVVYVFWSFILVAIFGFLLRPREVVKSVREVGYHGLTPIVISGVGYFLYNILTFSAYRAGGDVGSVDAINNTVVFLVIGFEFLIMRRRHSLWRKLLTALLACLGVAMLGAA